MALLSLLAQQVQVNPFFSGDDWSSMLNSRGHIITIEDPIEFYIPIKVVLLVNVKWVLDTESFEIASKTPCAWAPDVILIGEIRTVK